MELSGESAGLPGTEPMTPDDTARCHWICTFEQFLIARYSTLTAR